MKRKRRLITVILLIAGICGFYFFNKRYKLVDLSSISVSAEGDLSRSKVKIKKSFYSTDRESDQELFSKEKGVRTVYSGRQVKLLNTGYGENDFLVIYDDEYYFQFRHFIFNRNHCHAYHFNLFQRNDTIFLSADIKGPDQMNFERPMHLISDARLLRRNAPIDSNKATDNMSELKDR